MVKPGTFLDIPVCMAVSIGYCILINLIIFYPIPLIPHVRKMILFYLSNFFLTGG